jgi:hypothetical protein
MKHRVFKIILATIIGEMALVLFTTVAQEVLFDGIRYSTSPNFDIYVGGFATFIAAVLAGLVASYIVNGNSYVPALLISVLITGETTYLITSEATQDPPWADALAGLSLVLGIWLGYYLIGKFFAKKTNRTIS